MTYPVLTLTACESKCVFMCLFSGVLLVYICFLGEDQRTEKE